MTGDTEATTLEAEQGTKPIEEATDLIGTEGLWSGQILYTGVELGLFEILGDDPVSAE